jgi:hypothetical protein
MANPHSMPLNIHLSVRTGAIIALIGFILSAPIAFPLVMLIAPQPSWISVEIFKANYHPIQELPYYFGFVLIAGLMVLVFGHRKENHKDNPDLQQQVQFAHGLIVIFATLVIFNYICQTTLIPHLVRAHNTLYDPLIALLTMSNPDSLSWAIEMWAYLILAKALWLLRGCYKEQRTSLPALLTANLILSIISLVWTILDATWVATTLGLVLYFTWNALMIMILILIAQLSKDRQDLNRPEIKLKGGSN